MASVRWLDRSVPSGRRARGGAHRPIGGVFAGPRRGIMPLKRRHWQSGLLLGSVVPGGLCEREGELARVDALMTTARAGRGGVLLITGPAGIGKTVLLGAARERAGQAGMRVLAGRGGELEG